MECETKGNNSDKLIILEQKQIVTKSQMIILKAVTY